MSISRALRSVWLVRALILIVSHVLAVQFSQNAVTDVPVPADVIIAAPSGEGNFPANFTGENNGIATGTVIAWSAPQNIAGDSDIIIGGSLVGAFNVGDGGVGAATVNGVTFNPFALNSTAGSVSSGTVGNFTLSTADVFLSDNSLFGSSSGSFADLSTGYKSLLRSGTQVSNLFIDPAAFKLTINGLTLGHHYQFQWFANLSGAGPNSLHSASAGNTVTLDDNGTNLEGGLGQFAVGSFVANTLFLDITFSSAAGFDTALLNAFQLRDLDLVPEPAGTVLTLLGVGVLLCRRNRVAGGLSARGREMVRRSLTGRPLRDGEAV